jgi:hypothetical protein
MWYKQKHQLCRRKNNYENITHKMINLEIDNIIQDQMVRTGKVMVRIIRIIDITNVVIIKIIDFGTME